VGLGDSTTIKYQPWSSSQVRERRKPSGRAIGAGVCTREMPAAVVRSDPIASCRRAVRFGPNTLRAFEKGICVQVVAVIAGVVGFGLVVGYAGLAWLKRGRDPSFADDESILAAAPPPGMTAATATIVDGGPTRLAFMAALLDLASRDEIAFRQEPGGVGIAIRGAETDEARVVLNRRQPIGGGETWLLMQLKEAAIAAAGGAPGGVSLSDRVGESLTGLIRAGTFALGDSDSAQARAAGRGGLASAPAPDLTPAADDLLARMDNAAPSDVRAEASAAGAKLAQTMSDQAGIARDPDGYMRQLEAVSGKPLTQEERASIRDWAARYASRAAASPAPQYIPAERTRALRAPLLFGPLVEAYASRNGWVVGLPVWQRLKWRIIAVLEMVAVPWVLLVAGSLAMSFNVSSEVALGFTAGWLAGAIVTFLMAPAMTARTPAGARTRAQLAAYRRTLEMTFGQARSMDEVVASKRLAWIETPDQALVWGVALGLRHDIEGLLARTADLLEQGQGSRVTFVPAWYSSAPAGGTTAAGETGPRTAPASVAEAGAMFTALEAIGSGAGLGTGGLSRRGPGV
jgi:hypothetical protein